MNTRPYSFSTTLLAVGILSLLPLFPLRSDPMRLAPPVILSNGAVELNLTGQVGAAYSVEASVNLSNWFLVATGIATNGLLSFRHDTATNYPTLFYRAKGTNDSLPPLTVGLMTDTNLSVSTLVSLDGGSGVLYGLDGTRFTLTLPSNSIPDARILTMTLVTNITGLPFARGTLGAVVLEPADVVFWGAASLEITFPATTDRREVVSFFCHDDGSSFQLTPDRVGTNRVVISVIRAGAFGSSLATTQELANAARIETSSSPASGPALVGKLGAIGPLGTSTAECFPEKQAAADAAGREIDAARAAKSKEIAVLLGVERHKALAGESDDSSAVLAQVAAQLCAFYTSQIAPQWAAAANNCALGRVLIQNTLGVERQRELLGASDDCTDISNIPFCAIYTSCLEDVRVCCASGKKGPTKVAEVFGLLRQDQLLGLNCLSQSEAQDVIDLCSSNVWSGTFSMVETGSQVTTTPLPGGEDTSTREFTSRFDGAVQVSVETGDPAILTVVELHVVGQLTQRDFANDTQVSSASCPNGGGSDSFVLSQSEGIVATDTTYVVSFITQPGSYQFFQANNYDPNNPDPVMESFTMILYSRAHTCDGKEFIYEETMTSADTIEARALEEDSGDMPDPNVLSGALSMDDPDLDPPRHIEFKWKFTRHP